jgi:hypothetical protein
VEDGDEDPDREAIQKRRSRLIALALSGATIAASATFGACQPCLEPVYDAGRQDAGPDAGDAGG